MREIAMKFAPLLLVLVACTGPKRQLDTDTDIPSSVRVVAMGDVHGPRLGSSNAVWPAVCFCTAVPVSPACFWAVNS